jgi:hypothetical protein
VHIARAEQLGTGISIMSYRGQATLASSPMRGWSRTRNRSPTLRAARRRPAQSAA